MARATPPPATTNGSASPPVVVTITRQQQQPNTMSLALSDALQCALCRKKFQDDASDCNNRRLPISLPSCDHVLCSKCVELLPSSSHCPLEKNSGGTKSSDYRRLPVNLAIVKMIGGASEETLAASRAALDDDDVAAHVEAIAELLPQVSNRNIQKKLVALLQCQLASGDGRLKAVCSSRQVAERLVIDTMQLYQHPSHVTHHLWSAVRSRGCQFLGPAMQAEVLKLVLLALEDGSQLSRKVLVQFIVQKLQPYYSQASKTSIGHVVQLLYRASCFKVTKRDGESSLMELREDFRSYDALRREHDAQIVQLGMDAGIRCSPEQWSSILYGDDSQTHRAMMHGVIERVQAPRDASHLQAELEIVIQRTPDTTLLRRLMLLVDRFGQQFDPNPSSSSLAQHLDLIRQLVGLFVEAQATARRERIPLAPPRRSSPNVQQNGSPRLPNRGYYAGGNRAAMPNGGSMSPHSLTPPMVSSTSPMRYPFLAPGGGHHSPPVLQQCDGGAAMPALSLSPLAGHPASPLAYCYEWTTIGQASGGQSPQQQQQLMPPQQLAFIPLQQHDAARGVTYALTTSGLHSGLVHMQAPPMHYSASPQGRLAAYATSPLHPAAAAAGMAIDHHAAQFSAMTNHHHHLAESW